MSDGATQRRVNKEEVARFLFCHKYSTIIYFCLVNSYGLGDAEGLGLLLGLGLGLEDREHHG